MSFEGLKRECIVPFNIRTTYCFHILSVTSVIVICISSIFGWRPEAGIHVAAFGRRPVTIISVAAFCWRHVAVIFIDALVWRPEGCRRSNRATSADAWRGSARER